MSSKDIFQSIGSLDEDGVQKIVDRLEYRGQDQIFVELRDEYLRRMNLPLDADILDLGCGTGVVARALAAEPGRTGKIVGIDFSPDLIEAAKHFAANEGVSDNIEFRVGDAQAIDELDDVYDAVILHTLISHVPNPVKTISEAGRVVRAGGSVCIFDGDYASLCFATGNPNSDKEVAQAILTTIVANPHVMRELPSILKQQGFSITDFMPSIHAESGTLEFFSNMVDSYVPMAINAQAIDKDRATTWLNTFRFASENESAFVSCNYCTYIARRI
jgi:ubiquinone/menaquinone biosynthesis C-methylase UbiE